MNAADTASSPLLAPYALAALDLPSRVVMAPMTRFRADRRGVPTPMMAVYYAQRASAGLIVSEGVWPSVQGQQYLTEPGLATDEQVAAWRTVTDAVHAAGGRVFAQIMHAGRNGHPANRIDGGTPLAPSAVPLTAPMHTLEGKRAPVAPRAMSTAEVGQAAADHAAAARNALRAGFDGVEIHGANSYLPHQFLADNTNLRGDAYGGTAVNRARFVIELAEAVADAVGAERVGLRLAPGNPENEMVEADPAPVYRTALAAIDRLGLAYLHLTDGADYPALADLRPHWSGALVGNTGEHEVTTLESAERLISERGADLVSIGRPYIATPDLTERIAAGVPWSLPEGDFHYGAGERDYIDYPRAVPEPAAAVRPPPRAPDGLLGKGVNRTARRGRRTPWRCPPGPRTGGR
ncbi:N-ethylmaleimide reductase [Spinactinospora alkalitolerans]|uniref:N-ethylmaleimide reductase n=1 Tax=Spinactinospora alkalitolerans TaxID=687207 RepID=A0A852U0F0_9ACTN|nr:alkene reductase [Spinactinospora alkalitolerans]NYE50306.1 N-ethylmaleimide reductase [Spinactinospora alkalitolerans]